MTLWAVSPFPPALSVPQLKPMPLWPPRASLPLAVRVDPERPAGGSVPRLPRAGWPGISHRLFFLHLGERRVSPRFCPDGLFIYLLLFRFSDLCYRVSCLLSALSGPVLVFLLPYMYLQFIDSFF